MVLGRLPYAVVSTGAQAVMVDWSSRIGRHITPEGCVVVPARIAAWLEDKAGVTADRRIMLRDTDPEAYEVLAALRIAALQHRSANGTKVVGTAPDSTESEQWLTTSQAAAQVGVTDRCIRKWIGTGRLPAQRHGRDWRINPAHLHIRALAA